MEQARSKGPDDGRDDGRVGGAVRGRPRTDDLLDVLEDLEQQAAGLHLVERESEVADLAATEYAGVDLESRLRAALGHELSLRLRGGQQPRGTLVRAGAGWVVLSAGPARWLVPLGAVLRVGGAASRAAHAATRGIADAVPLRSLVRRLAEDPATGECALHLVDGDRSDGRLVRVGADFVELAAPDGGTDDALVPLAALAVLRWTR